MASAEVGQLLITLSLDNKNFASALSKVKSTNEKSASDFSKAWTASTAVVNSAVNRAFNAVTDKISSSINGAIKRVDTLNNFPKVMQSLGFSAEEASGSINTISSSLDGLPTSLNDMVGNVQMLTATMGNLNKGTVNATSVGLAFNNMMLAGGQGTQAASNAFTQYNQMLAAGKVDQQAWNSLVSAAPGQINQVARTLLGASAGQKELYQAMQEGTITFDDFNQAVVKLNEEGGEGFASFDEQARAATGGIGTAIENIQNRITKAIGDIIQAIGTDNIAAAIDGISSSFKTMGQAVVGVVKFFQEHEAAAMMLKGTLIALAAALVTIKIVDFGKKLSSTISSVKTFTTSILQLKNKTTEVAASVGSSSKNIAKSTDTMAKSGESLSTRLASSIKGISNVISTVFQSLSQILSSVVNAVMEPIKQIFKGIGEAIAGFFQALANPQIIVGVAVFTVAAAGVAAAILLVGSAIGAVTPGLANFLNTVLLPLGTFLRDTLLLVITVLTDNIIRLTQEAVIPLFQEVRSFLDWLFGKVEEVVGNVWNAISTLTDNIRNAFQGAWNFITGIFGNVAGWFRDRFNDAVNAIKSVFSGIGNFFASMWDRIVGIFGTIGERVGNVVSGAFKGIVNGVLSTVENILNGPIRAINGLIDVINNVPGVDLGHLNEFNLPRMEHGGIVPGNSWSGDNELIRANSGEMVITRRQQAGLWDFIQNSFSAAETETTSTGALNNPVTINQTNYFEKELTEEQIEELMSKSIRRAVV